MNERIEKLAEQAGFTVARGQGLKDTVPKDVFIANVCVSDEMKKFAELIVRECADIIENSRIEGDEGVCLVGATKCKIKQNFGVE